MRRVTLVRPITSSALKARAGVRRVSPELETLDQLLGGDLSLSLIRGLYPDDGRFARGMSDLLHSGEVRLVGEDDTELSRWRWREVLADPSAWNEVHVGITRAGARRIG